MAELEIVWRRHARRLAAADESRIEAHEAIVKALREGARPRDVIRTTGLTGEAVRQIARKAGLPPLREATVVSKRQAESDQG